MIVKMKKVTLLASNKYIDNVIGKLRGLGLMHIKHMENPVAEKIIIQENKLQLLDRAMHLLGDSKISSTDLDKHHISFYVKEIIILK